VTSRSVANAQYEQDASQDSYVNDLLLSVVGLLVSVALVNTLVVVTLQRRKELAVLRRVGATTRQLLTAATCQAGGLILIGVLLGIVAQIATVTTVSKAISGSPAPDIPWPSVTIILGLVALLTALAVLAPTARMVLQRKET
jgi:putative ABC transport system permease protein